MTPVWRGLVSVVWWQFVCPLVWGASFSVSVSVSLAHCSSASRARVRRAQRPNKKLLLCASWWALVFGG